MDLREPYVYKPAVMRFQTPLIEATLLRRYKRFLADVRLPDGREAVAHCPNPGAMPDLAAPGSTVWLADVAGPGRKLDWSWKLVREQASGALVLVDTLLANRIVAEALAESAIPALGPIAAIRPEVPYAEKSRVDFLLTHPDGSETLLEVKSVSLARDGFAAFPDAKSARAARHMHDLAAATRQGRRAAVAFLRVRGDDLPVAVAADVDPAYARACASAIAAGVAMIGLGCEVTPEGVRVQGKVPFVAPEPVLGSGHGGVS